MTIDPQLLGKAKEAEDRLKEAERQAQLARAEFHTHVRRLHLSSSSLREVAQALGISHQRVQQIVTAAGGSWWQKIWRSRNVKRDTVCSFCNRPPSEVAKLLAGPNVFICDSCIDLAEEALGGTAANPRSPLRAAGGRSKLKCTFCGKPRSKDRPIATQGEVSVCGECLGVCRQILKDRVPHPDLR